MFMRNNEESGITKFLLRIKPLHVFALYFIILLICIIAIILIDLLNVGGLRSYMEAIGMGSPRVWAQLFGTGGPIEIIQALFLGLLGLLSMFVSGRMIERGQNRLGSFWFLIGLFALVLFMEEAANLNTRFGEYMSYLPINLSSTATKTIPYLFYLGFALIPVLLYFKDIYKYKQTSRYLFAGYFVYGFIGMQSALHKVIRRDIIGDFIFFDLLDGSLYFYSATGEDLGNLFMDLVFEEPFELLAICLLLCSLFTFMRAMNSYGTIES